MENNDKKEGLFDSRFAKEYITCNDFLIKHAVTCITASCEMLTDIADRKGTKYDRHLIKNIMNICCNLMRNSVLGKELTADETDEMCISPVLSDAFLRHFAEKCEKLTSGRCVIALRDCPSLPIRTDLRLFRLLLLSFIRRYTLSNGAEKCEFEAFCEEYGENVMFRISAAGTFVDGEEKNMPNIFEMYSSEAADKIASRINAEVKLEEDSIVAVIPRLEANNSTIVEMPDTEDGEKMFGTFDLMLRDLSH